MWQAIDDVGLEGRRSSDDYVRMAAEIAAGNLKRRRVSGRIVVRIVIQRDDVRWLGLQQMCLWRTRQRFPRSGNTATSTRLTITSVSNRRSAPMFCRIRLRSTGLCSPMD